MTDPTPRELIAAATAHYGDAAQGPWRVEFPANSPDPTVVDGGDETIATVHGFSWDAEFIAHARTDVPALAAALEAALDENDRLREDVTESKSAEARTWSSNLLWQEEADRLRGIIAEAVTEAELSNFEDDGYLDDRSSNVKERAQALLAILANAAQS